MVIAPRAEYSSLQEFITAAFAFLEWSETDKEYSGIPASDTDLDFIKKNKRDGSTSAYRISANYQCGAHHDATMESGNIGAGN